MPGNRTISALLPALAVLSLAACGTSGSRKAVEFAQFKKGLSLSHNELFVI